MSGRHLGLVALIGGIVGGAIIWFLVLPRVERLERKVVRLESLKLRVQEFKEKHHNDVKRIEDEFNFLWKKIQEFKNQIPEMREKLDLLSSRLETTTNIKLGEKGYYLAK